MRLVTKTHDYYDGVIKTSISDKSFTFVREEREETIDGVETIRRDYRNHQISYIFRGGFIGFCGEVYPFINVSEMDYTKTAYESRELYFYDYPSLLEEFPKLTEKKNRLNFWGYGLSASDFDMWLKDGQVRGWNRNYSVKQDPRIRNFFFEQRIAYFVIQNREKTKRFEHIVHIYPELKRFEFYKIFDAYTTFQKIEMFLTNELVKPDELNVNIEDKLKAQSKGFNKWSFRKMKEG